MIKYILIFLLSASPFVGIAQTDIQNYNLLKTGMDSLTHESVLTYLSNTARVGLSVGIYQTNNLLTYHYGSTQKEKQELPNDKTIYEIGSISKTFTGTCLHKL